VVEAVKQITVDKEEQIFTLTGICRVEDISVDNTLLSTQLANLSLSKQTRGEVRDTTKRGWLNKFIDQVSPF
jgi:flagellar L-ring protein FlgH